MIKIGYFGDGPWASRALSHIVGKVDCFEVAFITPRYDTQDPALKEWALKLGVPFLPSPDVNDKKFIAQIAEFKCDLMVSMSFNQILKTPIINVAPYGFLNCHAGALPFYRGRNPLNWALINGEEQLGVTVHYVDEGIDTGDILVQNIIPVSLDDTYGSLLELAHKACADTLLEALMIVHAKKDGARAVARKQDATMHPKGFYCGLRRAGDEWVNWQDTSLQIHNFVRALALPGPGARTLSEKGELALLKSEIIADAPPYRATNGEVVGRNERGIVVKTGDSSVLIIEAAHVTSDGRLAEKFTPRWKIGTRLGLSPLAELHRLHNVLGNVEQDIAGLRAEIENLKEAQGYDAPVKKKI